MENTLKEKNIDKLLEILNECADKTDPGVKIIKDGTILKEEKHTKEILQIVFGFVGLLSIFYLQYKGLNTSFLLYLVVYAIAGYNVLYKAIRNFIRKEIFDENFLMMIASIGAFIVGSYEEAVAVMLLYQIGELFQDNAV